MIYLRSTLFVMGQVFITLLLIFLIPIALPFSFQGRYRILTQWTNLNLWWLRVTCNIRYRLSGTGHIPDGTSIIMAKHQSAWETLALQQIFPAQTWVLKRSLFLIPLFGWTIALLKPIAINRKAGKKALNQVVKQGSERLNEGIWLVIFPEGTRVRPCETGSYHIGGAMLAAKTGYPVVPVAHNAGEFWPRHGFLKNPGVIDVVIGPAITTSGKKAAAISAEVEEWIESTMKTISHCPADSSGTD